MTLFFKTSRQTYTRRLTFFCFSFVISISLVSPLAYAQPPASAFLQMGHTQKNIDDLDGAIEFYKKALAIDPNYEAAKSSLEGATAEKEMALFTKIFPSQCQIKSGGFQVSLDCAQKYFIIDGQPINPMIIKDLVSWESDSGDQVVAISLLDSQKSNKYFCDHLTAKREGKYFSVKSTSGEGSLSSYKGSFSYTLKGITTHGIFILETGESGGGSGVFTDLLFVRIKEDVGFGDVTNDKLALNRKRILIEKLGAIPLGNRVKSEITIEGNAVLLKTEETLPPYEQNTQKIMIEVKKKE